MEAGFKQRGRGVGHDPGNRFERLNVTLDPAELSGWDELPGRKTVFYKDASKTVPTRNSSPDIGYDVSLNPYRGCETGCVYCYARQTHEHLGFSLGLDFESKIMVKADAPPPQTRRPKLEVAARRDGRGDGRVWAGGKEARADEAEKPRYSGPR